MPGTPVAHRVVRAGAPLVAMVLVLGAPARAQAQTAQDKATAEVLFEEGKELMKQRKFGEACPKFFESNKLDTGIGTILWLADCYEKNGQTASAWGEFREAADIASRSHDPREKVARERSARLEPSLSRLALIVKPGTPVPGLVIKRDGVEVGQTLWGEHVPVDPGSHKIVATAPHKLAWETSIQVRQGVRELEITIPPLEAAPEPPPTPPPSTETDRPPDEPPPPVVSGHAGGTQRAVGGVLLGVGILGAVAGTLLTVFAEYQLSASTSHCKLSVNQCDPQGINDREQAQNATTGLIVAFSAGGALMIGGIVLIATAPSSAPSKPSVSLAPWFDGKSGGVGLGGRF